jgi:hypothetical protein
VVLYGMYVWYSSQNACDAAALMVLYSTTRGEVGLALNASRFLAEGRLHYSRQEP